ncbi:MAG: ribonuclease PH [Candidatus Calescibacterium sp.]|nr:ribonuclease PH [Candidatus Calescibacterium sp.]MCX7758366.1 ribonuclease PH [bacterium]
MRIDGRDNLQFRQMEFRLNYLRYPISSVLGVMGNTMVLVSVSFSDSLPDFCKSFGHGWITAEYRLLPSSTPTRNYNLVNSRSQEIKRIIGRALRSAFDVYKFPKHYVIVDCDVLQADGGTRVACINAGFIALVDAFQKLLKNGSINENPLRYLIAAMSFVIEDDQILLDPVYLEDSSADIDLNIVVNSDGTITELQFSAEKKSVNKEMLDKIIDISFQKSAEIFDLQANVLRQGGVEIVKYSGL